MSIIEKIGRGAIEGGLSSLCATFGVATGCFSMDLKDDIAAGLSILTERTVTVAPSTVLFTGAGLIGASVLAETFYARRKIAQEGKHSAYFFGFVGGIAGVVGLTAAVFYPAGAVFNEPKANTMRRNDLGSLDYKLEQSENRIIAHLPRPA